MPDDERTRRRVSDETKGRIADLASGWSVDPDPVEAAPEPEPPLRAPRSVPPPPPEARKPTTRPPPVPPRKAGATQPPPLPPRVGTQSGSVAAVNTTSTSKSGSVAAVMDTSGRVAAVTNESGRVAAVTSESSRVAAVTNQSSRVAAVTNQSGSVAAMTNQGAAVDRSGGVVDQRGGALAGGVAAASRSGAIAATDRSGGHLATPARQETSQPVPRGEFDVSPPPTHLTEPPLITETAQQARDDATAIDPGTIKFERGDPTQLGRDDPSIPAARPKVGRLRTIAALRRQRGWFGDVRYVATVMFGVRRSRRELAELEVKQQARQAERERYLVTLGRTAVITDSFDHPALGPAREKLGDIEDERARHRSQVIAADEELQRVTRDRETKAKQYTTDLASIDAELAELGRRLEPLQKEHASATRRAADLRETLRRIDAQIQETTASLVAVRSKKDPAAIQAELATLKADREGTRRDEPKLAQELDSLSPRIAAIEAKRAESTKRRVEILKSEEDDKGRTEELLAAIGAKRKVMDRAANDAEALRDKILFELAERLYVDRPRELGPQLAPIDAIDVELGSADRRMMELREIMSSIDRGKLARGIAMIALAVILVGGFTAWILYMSA